LLTTSGVPCSSSTLSPLFSNTQVGWFPEYTITEDYALSMELKSAGFKGRYLSEYLAVSVFVDH
jgi:cellulose synthase/poly-beta-1,6-N-acetylglucosamine synthase-like glycosyltransferase